MTPTLLAKRQAEYDAPRGPSAIIVDLDTFVALSIELCLAYPEAFHAHCAEVCSGIDEAIADAEDTDDPNRLCDRSVGRLTRFDINDYRNGRGRPETVFDTYSYTYLYQDKEHVVCAELDTNLLGADGRLYSTEVFVSTAGLRPFLRTVTGKIAETLHPEKLLRMTYGDAGVAAYAPLQALGHGLTEASTWAMIADSLAPVSALTLPDF
jgi:hypothetical protein